MKKTSVFLLIALLLSMLVPVLASAAVVFNGSYENTGYLSGQVRFDGSVGEAVYNDPEVTLGVYSSNGQHLQDVTVTLAAYDNGVSTYNIPNTTVLNTVYDVVYLQYGSDASGLIYINSPDDTGTDPGDGSSGNGDGTGSNGGSGTGTGSNGSDGGTGSNSGSGTGGGTGTGSSGDATNSIDEVDGTVDADQLKASFDKYSEVTIKVDGDTVAIPAAGIAYAKPGSILTIETDHGSYILPLSAIDLSDLADRVQADVEDMKIHIGIQEVTGDEAEAVETAIDRIDGKALSAAYEMSFSVEGTNGNIVDIANFDQYVKRTIPLDTQPSQTATIALYDPATGKLSFVPGTISAADSEATFWRTGNSIYTVVELDNTFNDIDDHWAKADIELLANKLIVEGMTDTMFEPDRSLTRAEFVALATRAFGLVDVTDGTYFSDVGLGSWYSGMVAAAAKAGLIEGYEDDTFRPNAPITREELAAIVVRAYRYAGGTITIDSAEQARLLAKYNDSDEIVWGQIEVAKALSAGFLGGLSNTTLDTSAMATRAQTVTALRRVLTSLHFID